MSLSLVQLQIDQPSINSRDDLHSISTKMKDSIQGFMPGKKTVDFDALPMMTYQTAKPLQAKSKIAMKGSGYALRKFTKQSDGRKSQASAATQNRRLPLKHDEKRGASAQTIERSHDYQGTTLQRSTLHRSALNSVKMVS